MITNRVCKLFNIRYPIIQAGMVWCSGWRLASAVSNAGCLGLIGAGSMAPEVLTKHIQKCKQATSNPFGVNVPLLYPQIDKIMDVLIREDVKIVFTSAGNPSVWTPFLKDKGITVAHVVSSQLFARKSEQAGVDTIVAEGFEAGGHNGREETTTMCLIPAVKEAISLPLIAAGGIASGRAMLATEALGAEGFQLGSRFVVAEESSAHENFKNRVTETSEGETFLALKKLTPVRLIKNEFYGQVYQLEQRGASAEELKNLLGRGRAKEGIFEGNLIEGELEIGQVASMLKKIEPAAKIVESLWDEYLKVKGQLCQS
jgi:enoyl-[acyl-carrier protein] reductase II